MENLITRENLAIIKVSAAGAVASTKYHSCKDVYIATNALLEDVILPMAERCEELLERVQFLERVAEQAVLLNGNQLRTLKFVPTRQTYETIQDSRGMDYKVSDYPDLAAYLRERASDAGQETKV